MNLLILTTQMHTLGEEAPYARVSDICPKLAQPWWYRHVMPGRFFVAEARKDATPPSRAAQKVIRRKARKHGLAEFLKAIAA